MSEMMELLVFVGLQLGLGALGIWTGITLMRWVLRR